MLRADLHIHSTASDGWLSPSDIVNLASALNLSYIALCDHDTVDGVPVALRTSRRHNDLTVIPSVELSTDYGNKNIHLLGYWIDHTNDSLIEHLAQYATASTERIKAMAQKLTDDGYEVTNKDLRNVAVGGMWRRPHLARILIDKGYAEDTEDVFSRFIGDDSPYFIPHHHISTKEGIDLIEKSGGIPFVAHPAVSGLHDMIEDIVGFGLKGIEAFHSHHTQIATMNLIQVADQNGLIVSGGSDWHGNMDDSIQFGASLLPEPYLSRFLDSNPRELPTR